MRYNPNTFGLEGAMERKEHLTRMLIRMRLEGKLSHEIFLQIVKRMEIPS